MSFSSCNISSTDNLCNTFIPAASAHVVTVSLFRLISDVSCACSCFARSVGEVTVDGVERCCSSCSCTLDRRCRVLMLQSCDPTCGAESGRSLTSVWLADCSVSVPSGLV